jgi:cyclophilin family peptidyl-prolyl cis-trans isomerase
MENSEPKKSFPWLIVIVIVLIILALLQWWQTGLTAPEVEDTYTKPDTSVSIPPVTTTPEQPAQTPTTTNNPPTTTITKNFMHTITLETSKGTIVFETYDADAPKTVENFITLANKGFYNNLIFHRIIEGFMIQGGDPTGTGMGGPGYKFADELNPSTISYKTGYVRGIVAMANSGPNTNGSQFFIMHKDTPLPNKYSIFGRVIKGMEVVDAIATSPRNENDKPLTDIVIKKATVTTK